MEMTLSQPRSRYRWVVFCALAVTYLVIFSQRTGPGVIANQLQAQFGVSSAVLGTMASVQYFLYMVLQVPIGAFADRIGPERLLILGTALDGAGTVMFSMAPSFSYLLVGRALVGAGDAFIWINMVLIVGKWFAAEEFGGVLGLIGTFGNLGAILASMPLAAWVSAVGWRGPFLILGLLLLLIAVANAFALQRTWVPWRTTVLPVPALRVQRIPLLQTLKRVVRDQVSWATFLCHFGVMGSYLGFMGLWAVPVFMTLYHMSRAAAAQFILVGYIGAIVGGPMVGYISDKFGQRKRPYIALQSIAALAWFCVPLTGGHPPEWLGYVIVFVLGFGCGGSLLTFATIREVTPRERAGVTSGFANMGGFLSAVLLPVVFGAVIDTVNPEHASGAAADRAYLYAFLVPTIFSLLGILGSCLLPGNSAARSEE